MTSREHKKNGGGRTPWRVHSVSEDQDLSLALGPLNLWIRTRQGELWTAHVSGKSETDQGLPQDSPPPEDAAWSRWAGAGDVSSVKLAPLLPDRPVVVEPDIPFHLVEGGSARIYVGVPLTVGVSLAGRGGEPLTEIPSVILSDTWWGSFTEGERCYWVATAARRRIEEPLALPHIVVCPLQLTNRSDSALSVQELALRVEHLSIFASNGTLWANETRVRYRGEDEGSEIEMGKKPPAEAPDADLLSNPRTPVDRSITARTFARLKSLPGIGGAF